MRSLFPKEETWTKTQTEVAMVPSSSSPNTSLYTRKTERSTQTKKKERPKHKTKIQPKQKTKTSPTGYLGEDKSFFFTFSSFGFERVGVDNWRISL